MAVRQSVKDFVALGPLPTVRSTKEVIHRHRAAFERIEEPVSDEEARLLTGSFGPDDCFGIAWSLLHLIETAPGAAVEADPGPDANEWVQRLWKRWERSLEDQEDPAN